MGEAIRSLVFLPTVFTPYDPTSNYLSQMKFAKFMFSQESVCPQGVCAPLHVGRYPPPGQTLCSACWDMVNKRATGMHSCFISSLSVICMTRKHSSRIRASRLRQPYMCFFNSHQMLSPVEGGPQVDKFEQVPSLGHPFH